MDLVTQGLIGACTAAAVAAPAKARSAALIGLLAGLAADVDILIASDQDPLLNLEFHRHFTHSIFFIPVLALLLSLLLWPVLRSRLRFHELLLFSFAGGLLSGFIDACTSYGTRLLWPLSPERFSFNIISIVDPIFTLLLFLGVVLVLVRRQRFWPGLTLVLATAYLGFGIYQNIQVRDIALELARSESQQPQQLLVKPTLGNLILWRAVYRHQDRYYVRAIRFNPFSGETKIFPGGDIAVFEPGSEHRWLAPGSVLQQDILRFNEFSAGYLAAHPDGRDGIIDVRYANLPDQIEPLWGIEFDASKPDQHAHFVTYRDRSEATRGRFVEMLFD